MLSGSPTTSTKSSLQKYTPLPLSQIAILLLLRFCEAASAFVIFPFLNEVSNITDYYNRFDPREIMLQLAPYICDRRCKESRILRWLIGPSLRILTGYFIVRDGNR